MTLSGLTLLAARPPSSSPISPLLSSPLPSSLPHLHTIHPSLTALSSPLTISSSYTASLSVFCVLPGQINCEVRYRRRLCLPGLVPIFAWLVPAACLRAHPNSRLARLASRKTTPPIVQPNPLQPCLPSPTTQDPPAARKPYCRQSAITQQRHRYIEEKISFIPSPWHDSQPINIIENIVPTHCLWGEPRNRKWELEQTPGNIPMRLEFNRWSDKEDVRPASDD